MSGSNSTPDDDWVRLNVGGKIFETTKFTLSQHPGSFLARLVNGGLPSKQDKSGAFLIDRSYEHFDKILNYLRTGSGNFDLKETTVKELLSEADFYNIQPLVEEIHETLRRITAMDESATTNRTEMVIVVRNPKYVSIDSQNVSVNGYLMMSEKCGQYEVLQALLQKIQIMKVNTHKHPTSAGFYKYYITSTDDDTWMNIELTLRNFGFLQEFNDDMYNKVYHSGYWKFVRTVRE